MSEFSTRQAAKKLGITQATLSRYVSSGKVPGPKIVRVGHFYVHSWTTEQVEELRKLLPKIANGRKTRYQKKQSAVSNQQSGKAKPRKHKKK